MTDRERDRRRPDLERLINRIHRDLKRWGGQDEEVATNMRSWIRNAVRDWDRRERKRKAP